MAIKNSFPPFNFCVDNKGANSKTNSKPNDPTTELFFASLKSKLRLTLSSEFVFIFNTNTST